MNSGDKFIARNELAGRRLPRLIAVGSYLAQRIRTARRSLAEVIDPSLVEEAQLAYIDPYTELPNSRAMKRQFNEMLSDGRPFGVIMLDIDDFKAINTKIGHAFADEVLKQFAQTLEFSLRKDDEVFYGGSAFRTGGDEFIVLASLDAHEQTDLTAAERVDVIVQRVQGIACTSFTALDGTTVPLRTTASGLVADSEILEADSYTSFMNRLSTEMLAKKQRG